MKLGEPYSSQTRMQVSGTSRNGAAPSRPSGCRHPAHRGHRRFSWGRGLSRQAAALDAEILGGKSLPGVSCIAQALPGGGRHAPAAVGIVVAS